MPSEASGCPLSLCRAPQPQSVNYPHGAEEVSGPVPALPTRDTLPVTLLKRSTTWPILHLLKPSKFKARHRPHHSLTVPSNLHLLLENTTL